MPFSGPSRHTGTTKELAQVGEGSRSAASIHFPKGWSATAACQAIPILQRAGAARKGGIGTGVTRRIRDRGRAETRKPPVRVAFAVLRWSLASQHMRPVVCSTAPDQATSAGLPFLKGRSCMGGCSCRMPAVVWAGRDIFQQPVHHWHPSNSNRCAVGAAVYFQ